MMWIQALSLVGMLLMAGQVSAQTYPNTPIKVVVGYAAGGAVEDGLLGECAGPAYDSDSAFASGCVERELVGEVPVAVADRGVGEKGASATAPPGGAAAVTAACGDANIACAGGAT